MKRAVCRVCGERFPYLVPLWADPRCWRHIGRDAHGRYETRP